MKGWEKNEWILDISEGSVAEWVRLNCCSEIYFCHFFHRLGPLPSEKPYKCVTNLRNDSWSSKQMAEHTVHHYSEVDSVNAKSLNEQTLDHLRASLPGGGVCSPVCSITVVKFPLKQCTGV